MDRDRQRAAMLVFQEAIGLGTDERSKFIASACSGDAELAREVEALFLHDRDPPRFLRDDVLRGRRRASEALPDSIGRYRVIRRLGQGGMGTVFEAEQDSPRRAVALKILHPWLATPSTRARFEREADLLGRLRHPGIAQVYDAGHADSGFGRQPYFAMELVDGALITDFATQRRLGLRERLALIAAVCDAAHHAHEHGVVHCDLKPGNVLVDAAGQPKILDFGIARVVGTDPQRVTLATQTMNLLGTLAYMSPEQATGKGREIDRRTDVYALGVLAFELLTGRMPIDISALPVAEALRAVAESDPVPAGECDPALRGDVETILSKMLEHEPARRYATAAAIADDIRRYLTDRPIAARPTSAVYQLGKLARRHRAIVAGLATTFLALVAGLLASLHFAAKERHARNIVDAEHAITIRHAARADLLLASIEMRSGNVQSCRRLLDQVPEAHRNFEWKNLERRFDDSIATWATEGSRIEQLVIVTGTERVLFCQGTRQFSSWTPFAAGPALPIARDVVGIDPSGASLLVRAPDLSVSEFAFAPDRNAPSAAGKLITPTGAVLGEMCVVVAKGGTRAAIVHKASAMLIEVGSGRVLAKRTVSYPPATRAVFRPDGAVLALVANDVVLLDAATGDRRGSFRNVGPVRTVAYSPDGSILASSSAGAANSDANPVVLRGAEDLASRSVLSGHEGPVMAIAFSPDGTRIATGSSDATVRLWDVASGRQLAVFRGHHNEVISLAFASDGSWLCSGSRDGEVRVFDTIDLETDVLEGHSRAVYPVTVAPDGGLIASGGWDDTVRLWDPRIGREVATLRGHRGYIHDVQFAPDGETLASASHDKTVRRWSVSTGRELAPVALPGGPDPTVLAYRPDGRRLAIGSAGPGPTLWIAEADGSRPTKLVDGGSLTTALAYSPDGRRLFAGSSDGILRCFEGDPPTLRAERGLELGDLLDIAVEATGERVVIATTAGPLAILDARDLSPIAVLRGHRGESFGVAFTADGTRIVSGGRDTTLRIWDSRTFEPLSELSGHGDFVYSVGVARDGAWIVSGSGDHTLRLWDTRPRAERLRARRDLRAMEPALAERARSILATTPDSDTSIDAAVASARLAPDLDPVARRELWFELLRQLTRVER